MKIANKIRLMIAGLVLAVSGLGLAAAPAMATSGLTTMGDVRTYLNDESEVMGTGTNSDENTIPETVNRIVNLAIGLIGLLAVIMIIVGGFQYTTSSGDSGKVTKAKNTILYGVIGLVIALLAYAIVNFVLGNLKLA